MQINITCGNVPVRPDVTTQMIVDALNECLSSPKFFHASGYEGRILFGSCSNTLIHNKLISLLCLYTCNNDVARVYLHGDNSMIELIKSRQSFLDFIKSIGNIADVKINLI